MLEPGQVIQWWLPTMNSEYKDSSFCPSCPHFPTRYAPFSIPHSTHCKDWVVSFKFLKWITGFGKNVGITAKKSDYNSTRSVSGCFDVKSSSMLPFTAVESRLIDKRDCSQFSHTARQVKEPAWCGCNDRYLCMTSQHPNWSGRRLIYYNFRKEENILKRCK